MWKSLFLSLGISTGVAVQALPKAVCFRFDDNQNVRNYSVMAETFRKNNAVFSLSLSLSILSTRPTDTLIVYYLKRLTPR